MQNILAVVFKNESEGFQAITELRQQPVSDKYAILQMALVKRQENKIQLCDGFDSGVRTGGGAALGGLLGGLLGILGGPLGVLLLGSYGALVGSTAGAADTLGEAALIEMVASKLADGEIALIALAEEEDETALDSYLSKFQAECARFDAAAIAEEVDEAADLQLEEDRQALLQLRRARKEDRKARIEDKRTELKADFKSLRESKLQKAEADFDRLYGDK